MHLIGRWEKVRSLGNAPSMPYLLDRKWARLMPYQHEQWWRSPEGVWCPVTAGGASIRGTTPRFVIGQIMASGNSTYLDLTTAYTAGSAGRAFANRLYALTTSNITEIYFYNRTKVGAGDRDILIEVRPYNTNKPDTAVLTGSTTIGSISGTGWYSATGLSIAVTAANRYFIVIGDPDGSGTLYASPYMGGQALNLDDGICRADYTIHTTTDGWQTANNFSTQAQGCVLVCQADGTWTGMPYIAAAASSSTTNRRGWYVSGLGVNLKIWAMGGIMPVNTSALELWTDDELPNGTVTATTSVQLLRENLAVQGYMFDSAPELLPGHHYRFTYVFSPAATMVKLSSFNPGATAIAALGFMKNYFYWAEANGTTNWSNDDTTAIPGQTVLYIDDWMLGGGGEGGGPLVGGRLVA